MMNYTGWEIPDGKVVKVEDASGRVLWKLETSKHVVLEVEKITSNTYAGETTYNNEQFILLDIYPKTNGTVSVTYGGLTKTITDTSGAEEPNAQQVFFGTFNGVADSVETPSSGTLTIEGDCRGFGNSMYKIAKTASYACYCIVKVTNFGDVSIIPDNAFSAGATGTAQNFAMTSMIIPEGVVSIGEEAFKWCMTLQSVTFPASVLSIGAKAFSGCSGLTTVAVLATTPPTLSATEVDGKTVYPFQSLNAAAFSISTISVPKGCGDTYKAAEGWSEYADYIVEAS